MSVKIERSELVAIAQSVYNGNDEIETFLKKRLKEGSKTAVFKKMEEKLWERMVEQVESLKLIVGLASKKR